MTDLAPFSATTKPMVYLERDWNNLCDHGLEKNFDYIVRVNGAYYEAIKGGTSSSAGTISYGGADNAGTVDGTDADAVIQAAIDAIEAAGGGSVFIKKGDYSTDATITIEGDNCYVHSDYANIQYSGAAQAVILGTAASRKSNLGISRVIVTDTGGTGTVGIEVLDCDQAEINNCATNDFITGVGMKFNGGADHVAICTVIKPMIGECQTGMYFTGTSVNSVTTIGGYIFYNTKTAGTKGIDLASTVIYCTFYGTYIEKYTTGVDNDGDYHGFYNVITEGCTDGIIHNSGANQNNVISPIFVGNTGTDYTDNGALNTVTGSMYGVNLQNTRNINSVSAGNITIKLGDNAGANKLFIADSDDAQIFSISSDGDVDCGGGDITDTPLITATTGSDLNIRAGDAAGATSIHLGTSAGTAKWSMASTGTVNAHANFHSSYKRVLENHSSNDTLTTSESGSIHTNQGSSGTITLTLPDCTGLPGFYFEFAVGSSNEFRIDPGAAGAIYINGSKATDNYYIHSNTINHSVMLVADGSGDWIAFHDGGNWTVQV